MKGDHYKKLAACGHNCLDWLENDDRQPWRRFCAEQFLAFGFGEELVRKCLEQASGIKTVDKEGNIQRLE